MRLAPIVTGLVLATWAPLTGPCNARAQPFVDVTAAVGIGGRQHNLPDVPPAPFSIYREAFFYTGGAAVGDYDDDGDPDVYLTRFGEPDSLYRNDGGTFTDVAASVGITGDVKTNGALFVDVDGDGDLDLYVTTISEDRHLLFIQQQGAGGVITFTEEARARGVALDDGEPLAGSGIGAGDYDRDGYIDLFVTEWLWEYDSCAEQHSRLLRNLGASNPGHFEDVTEAAGVWMLDRERRYPAAFGAAFSDLDGDDLVDLAIVSDFGTSRLFWNRGDGTFEDGTEAAGVGTAFSEMGSTLADFDDDGDLDWFVSAIFTPAEPGTGNRLYVNEGGRRFTDQTAALGLTDAGWGWGALFADFDYDGTRALFVTNDGLDVTRYFVRDGGTYRDDAVAAGVAQQTLGRGVSALDYDGDGDLDILLTNNGDPPVLYRNDATAGDYAAFRVRGAGGNRFGLGARVTTVTSDGRTFTHEPGTETQYLGQHEGVVRVGLGAGFVSGGGDVDVTVRFPTGHSVTREDVPLNQIVTITEPAGPPPLAPLPVARRTDCNGNGVPDACDVDCDDNGRPDACDTLDGRVADCDGNRVPDSCQLSSGTSADCDGNGVPDECELETGDCDDDGVLDACEAEPVMCPADLDAGPAPPPTTTGGVRGGSCAAGPPVRARGSALLLLVLLLARGRRRSA